MPQNFLCCTDVVFTNGIFDVDQIVRIQPDLVDILIPAYTAFVFYDL
jgi:hypothetical protein